MNTAAKRHEYVTFLGKGSLTEYLNNRKVAYYHIGDLSNDFE